MTDMIMFFFLMCAGATVDFLWVWWMRAVADDSRASAALSSMALGAVSLLGVGASLGSVTNAVGWILGLGAGTMLAMEVPRGSK